MAEHKRGVARTQSSLLPASIEDYVGSHALVRVIDAYVSGLDMAALGFAKSRSAATGRPAYAPQDLLGLYLYGHWNRIRSSRRLEAECKRNLELMWLMGELAPDHKTIAEFRRINAESFQQACAQFVGFLREIELVGGKVPTVAVDGSKFKANASKRSLMDAEQMVKERQKIQRRIDDYLKQMDQTDAAEQGEAELTPEQIEQALERLRTREQKLERAQSHLSERPTLNGSRATPRAGLTDADCVLLKQACGAYAAGYNVQQAVDTRHHLIIAHEVTTHWNDQSSLHPMATQAQAALDAEAMRVVADTGYMNGQQSGACEAQGIEPLVPMQKPSHTGDGKLFAKTKFVYDKLTDTYRCPAGALLERSRRCKDKQADEYTTRACEGCALKRQCTGSDNRSISRSWYADEVERAAQRAQANPKLMRLRSASVEHPFGNLKAMLDGGFSVRGQVKVKGEMALAVLTYNLKRTLKVLGIEKLMQKFANCAVFQPA